MANKPGHASSLLEQLKQAKSDGNLPDELAEKHDLDDESGGSEAGDE